MFHLVMVFHKDHHHVLTLSDPMWSPQGRLRKQALGERRHHGPELEGGFNPSHASPCVA